MNPVLQAAAEMEVSNNAVALLGNATDSRAAVQVLLAAGRTQDALKLLARLLPKRYVVAWLCQCARAEPMDEEDRAGVALAEAWVRDPQESQRRAALDFADAGGYRTPGAWLAAAAGWSGGSLAPATQATPVPPGEHLTACAAVAAVNLIAARVTDAFEARRRASVVLAMGLLRAGHADGTPPRES